MRIARPEMFLKEIGEYAREVLAKPEPCACGRTMTLVRYGSRPTCLACSAIAESLSRGMSDADLVTG